MNPEFEDATTLRKILEVIPDHVLVLNREGTILYINHVEEGYDRDEVIGASAYDIMSDDSKRVLNEVLASVFEDGVDREYESLVNAPDGSDKWYRSRIRPLRHDGRVVAGVLVAVNISDLKAAQQSAEQYRRLLPVCSWCDRIQDDDGNWEPIAIYVARATDSELSHGLCPECYARQTGEMEGDGPGA